MTSDERIYTTRHGTVATMNTAAIGRATPDEQPDESPEEWEDLIDDDLRQCWPQTA